MNPCKEKDYIRINLKCNSWCYQHRHPSA